MHQLSECVQCFVIKWELPNTLYELDRNQSYISGQSSIVNLCEIVCVHPRDFLKLVNILNVLIDEHNDIGSRREMLRLLPKPSKSPPRTQPDLMQIARGMAWAAR